MPITIDDLTINMGQVDRDTLLSDWQWLIGTSRTPILVTAMGDAFIQDRETGAVALLDVTAGELVDVADGVETFRQLLADREFVATRLAVNEVVELRSAGLALGAGQVYSWKVPPVLGGEFDVANVEITDLSVHFSISGQIHRQVAELPPGTPLSGVEIRSDEPESHT